MATARTEGALAELGEAIEASGGTVTLVTLDLVDGPAIGRLAAALGERHAKLDLLLHAAAATVPFSPVAFIDPGGFQKILALHVGATQALIAAFDPWLRRAPHGQLLYIDDYRTCGAFRGAYAASKAAARTLIETYAEENRQSGLRIRRVLPPDMATALRQAGYPGASPVGLHKPEQVAERLLAKLEGTAADTVIDLQAHKL